MKQHLMIAPLVSTLILVFSVQNVFGGAVMSVDLGSEWMKVSLLYQYFLINETWYLNADMTFYNLNVRLALYHRVFLWKLH